MKNRLLIFGGFAHDSQGVLAAVHRLAGVCVKLLSHSRLRVAHVGVSRELGVTTFADSEHRDVPNLRRIVCLSEDGFLTLSALKWVSDIGASFVMLDRIGKVLFVTGPTASSDSRVRHSQSLALDNGCALAISKELISAKLRGQRQLLSLVSPLPSPGG